MRFTFKLLLVASIAWLLVGCSVRKMAIKSLADALSETSSVYATDNDLEFVRDALPFGLKTIEALILKAPEHKGLLLSAAAGFTQYAYAFVESDAEALRSSDATRAREQRIRAKLFYLRARDYAFQALELKHPGFRQRLTKDPAGALAELKPRETPELYWATVSWAAAIASDKEDMNLVADLPLIEPMIYRCLALDEAFDQGAIHQFLISFEGGRSESQGGSIERARQHFQRALGLSGGKRLGAYVSLAETVSVQTQDRAEFERLLGQALAFDVNSAPDSRLANLVAQKRARLLLSQIDDLFL